MKEAIRQLMNLNKGIALNGFVTDPQNIPDYMFDEVREKIQNAAKKDPDSAWKIFRAGTNEEFSSLVGWLDVLPSDFVNDKSLTEIMRIAKKRGTPDVLENTWVGFGDLFDKFYNETTQAAYIAPAISTFGQVANG